MCTTFWSWTMMWNDIRRSSWPEFLASADANADARRQCISIERWRSPHRTQDRTTGADFSPQRVFASPETINRSSIWAARDASQWDRGAKPQIRDHTLRFFQLPRVSIDHRAFLSDAMDAGWQSVQFSDIVGRQDRPLFQGHLLKLSHWFLVQAARYL